MYARASLRREAATRVIAGSCHQLMESLCGEMVDKNSAFFETDNEVSSFRRLALSGTTPE